APQRLLTQAGQTDADIRLTNLVEEVLQHAVDAGVVARAQGKEADFLVSGGLKPALGDAADVVRVALAGRPGDHADLAETAPARAAALDFGREPSVHRLHERVDRLLRVQHQAQRGVSA